MVNYIVSTIVLPTTVNYSSAHDNQLYSINYSSAHNSQLYSINYSSAHDSQL